MGVGVPHEAREYPLRGGEVVAELGAAEGMGEGPGLEPVPAPRFRGDVLGHPVDATHRGDDPDLVPYPDPPVWTPEAHEAFREAGRKGGCRPLERLRRTVAPLPAQGRREVAGMDPGAGLDVARGYPDRMPVLEDDLALRDSPERDLVAAGNSLLSHDHARNAG